MIPEANLIGKTGEAVTSFVGSEKVNQFQEHLRNMAQNLTKITKPLQPAFQHASDYQGQERLPLAGSELKGPSVLMSQPSDHPLRSIEIPVRRWSNDARRVLGTISTTADDALGKIYMEKKELIVQIATKDASGRIRLGTGILISDNGKSFIATNYHVICHAAEDGALVVRRAGTKKWYHISSIAATEPDSDLAILRIDPPDGSPWKVGIDVQNLQDSIPAKGDRLMHFGCGTERLTEAEVHLAVGEVKQFGPLKDLHNGPMSGFNPHIEIGKTNAPIVGGMSGGPVFDCNGNFVGLNRYPSD